LAHTKTLAHTETLALDAYATHKGACLQQQLHGKQAWQHLGFFSKKLKTVQQKCSAFFLSIFLGDFLFFFIQYSALLHLPPLRFRCADGFWD
jgi:hypothetical protein